MKFQMGLLRPFDLRTSLRRAWLVALAILMLSLVAFGRIPASARGVLWAEDGGIFLRDAMARRGLLDITAPYDGYLHLIPRLAAKIVVRFFGVDDYALAMNFLGCLVAATVAVAVFYCSKELTSNLYARLAWASITVLVAPAPLETLGNFANIHSYFLWLTPWLLLKRASSRTSAALLFLAALAVSLTEIVAVLFLPLLAFQIRDRTLWPARFGLAAGLTFQAIATVASPRSHPESFPLSFPSVIIGWFLNSPAALVYGNSATIISSIQHHGAWAVVVATAPFAFAVGFVFWKGSRQQKALGILFLYASAGVWIMTQFVNFQEYFDYAAFDAERWKTFFLSRYSTVPSMFVLALLPLGALCGRDPIRWPGVTLLTGFVLLQLVYFFPQNTARNDGPDWQTGVRAARQECTNDPALQNAFVDIAPDDWLKGGLALKCAELRPSP
ncbi:conserved membrane hypothetical protein [Arthrobacter sp. 9AX]|uniref:hypothetical protein n=1 Tax=Arthrobacter sp. 9AX TaxID=2653131 RepID=UPI0012F160F2|nr:hypothetical protein [Arthrobacter sp. 9AX]VXB55561.1 conserved membrane hypothetical protein [Arthrobacter sp. 9AX]